MTTLLRPGTGHRPNNATGKARRKAEWVRSGLCSLCGRRPPVTGGKSCEECRAYHRNYRTRLREKGMCKCGRLPMPNGRNCELCRAVTRRHNRNNRRKCIDAYGAKCACCGERTYEFLQIDHINNDGAAHRREMGNGTSIYLWLIKRGFPLGFQILCANCNYAKAHYGTCPHKKGSKDANPATAAEAS